MWENVALKVVIVVCFLPTRWKELLIVNISSSINNEWGWDPGYCVEHNKLLVVYGQFQNQLQVASDLVLAFLQ